MNAFASCIFRFVPIQYLFFSSLFFLLTPVFATHDMGADLTYRCLGGDTYEFTLVFYRSCEENTPAPLTAPLSIRSSSCGYGAINGVPGPNGAIQVSLPLVDQLEITPICPADLGQSQCADINNPIPGVEEYFYTGQVTLPAKCRDWTVSWSTCCRNANITNAVIIETLPGTDMRLEIDLNNLDVDCNNSPTFTNIPTPFIASGEPYWYNHGVVDPDGDSLVFEMVNPIEDDNFAYPNSNSIPVTFLPGFTPNQPISTIPANGFEFDETTGQMFFVPDGPQWAIMTVKVSEYRDGVFIGSIMRDLQIVVRDDNTNKPPIVSPPTNVTGGSNTDYTFSVCANSTLSFDLLIEDPDVGDAITIAENIAAALPGAVVTTAGTNPLTLSTSWATTDADIGSYFFLLKAEDSNCPIIGQQSVGYRINVHEGVIAIPRIATICPGVPNNVQLGAQVTGGAGAGAYLWEPATGLSNPNISNPIATVSEPTTYVVTYTESGCITSDTVNIVPEGTLDILTQDPTICLGDNVQLETQFNFTLASAPACGPNSSSCVGTPVINTVGNGTTPTGTGNSGGAGSPFLGSFEDARTQVLYRAADLQAAGLEAGLITDLTLSVIAKLSASPFTNFTIKMGCVADNTLANFNETDTYVVFQQDFTTVLGDNTIALTTPYEWDGNSNLLVEFCYNRADNTADGMDHLLFTGTPYNSVLYAFSDVAGDAGCNLTNAVPSTQRPNIQFTTCALTAPTTYSWAPTSGLSDPNIANPIASPTTTTTYTVTASTPTCSYSDTLRVNVSQPPSLAVTSPLTICEGESIQLTVAGSDIDNATFSWSPAQTLDDATAQNPIASPTATTNYIITATNQCGDDTDIVTVNVQQAPDLTIDLDNISCFGSNDGAISISPTGAGGYRYNWTPNVGTGANVNNLSARDYTVIVTDANDCMTDTVLTIVEPPILVADIQNVTDADCNGENTGEIIVTASGGTPGYEYAINVPTFFPTNTFSNVGAGIYTMTVRDASDCEASTTVQVGEPPLLVAEIVEQIDVDCNGNATGIVELSGNGGTPPYDFSLDGVNFSANGRFTDLPARAYTGIVRDANGCTSPIQVNITEPTPLTVDISIQVDADCFGASTGSLTVFSTGGTPGYEFSLDGTNFTSSANFIGLPAGDYDIMVRDGRGCTSSISTTIGQPSEIIGDITNVIDVSCFGGNDGQITASASGGNPGGYLYAIDNVNFIGEGIFGGLQAGDYTITVSDFIGCRSTVDVTVAEPTELLLDVDNQINVDCNGNSTGSITLVATGGTPTYEYSRNGVDFFASPTFDNLNAGLYTFSVRDLEGCITNIEVEITEPELLTGSLASITPVDCNGNGTGAVTISPSGGTPDYEFAIDGSGIFGPDSSFSGLVAGPHIVDIRDDNGCTNVVTFDVTEPTPVTGIVDALVDVDCNGNSTGLINITGRGGTPLYEYAIDLDPNNFSASGTFTSLPAADYTLTIRDINGCTKDTVITVDEPSPLLVALDELIDVDCNGSGTGEILAVGTGGTPNYEFSIDGEPFNTGGNFDGLEAGNYTLTIRDANSCLTDSVVTIAEPDSLEVLIVDQIDAVCNGTPTASLEVGGTGGTPDYTFSLNASTDFSTNTLFENIPAGVYNVNIRDDRNCVNTREIEVGEPEPLVSVIDSVTGVDCFGNATGEVVLETVGGTAPYTYSIDSGNNFIPDGLFTGLPSDQYTVIVRDVNDCETSVAISVTQPDSIEIDLTAQDATCNGENDGIIITDISGGTPTYTYEWDNNPALNQPGRDNLAPGIYTLVIIDDNDCRSENSVEISEPDPITLTADVTDESCTLANGEATINVLGGTGIFTYEWQTTPIQTGPTATNLSAGTYVVTVTDENGCNEQAAVNLIDNEAPVLALDTLINATCFDLANGSISIIATMGTGIYDYTWDVPASPNSPVINNLAAGTYTVTVDDGRCTSTFTADITEPDSLYAIIDSFSVPSCFGFSNGTATVEAFGGTPGYTYSWDSPTPQMVANAVDLPDGIFTATVTDANGCETNVAVTLTEPAALVIDIDPQDVRCSGNNDGSALANVTGGTPPYNYEWSNGTTDSLADGLGVGSYTITITDFNNCIVTEDLTLDGPPPLESEAVHTDLTCFESADGTAEVAALGGVPPYAYQWSNGGTTSQLDKLVSGDYFVEVIDANDCVDTAFVVVAQPDDIIINIVDIVDSYCDLPNGMVRVAAQGGTPDYEYVWNTGDMGDSLSQIWGAPLGGPYTVIVRDLNGCEKGLDVDLKNSSPAIASFEMNRDPNEPILLSQSEIQFINTSQNSATYEWYFDVLDSTTIENPTFEFPQEGEYTIRLVANDPQEACPDDTTIVINIIFDGVVYVPNAFTPNGDGHNDLFQIGAEGIVSMELIIFDRWGTKLRTLYSPDEAWDGTNQKGNHVQEGVYTYVLKAVLNSGQIEDRGGTITLIR